MPRPYLGPKLWFDEKRKTWTICDGRKRVRTGYFRDQRDLAVVAIHKYSNGTYNPVRPSGPILPSKANARKGVYVIGFGSYVKIGITTDLNLRLAGLQAPEPLQEYALLNGWLKEERSLHARFAEYRLQGEWFRHEGELAEWIKGGCK